jgi:hypothetical protein
MQTDKDRAKLPRHSKSRSLPADRRARRRALDETKREPTPAELEADKSYFQDNPDLAK